MFFLPSFSCHHHLTCSSILSLAPAFLQARPPLPHLLPLSLAVHSLAGGSRKFWHRISALNQTHAHAPCAQSTHASDVSCSEPRESEADDTAVLPYARTRTHASPSFTNAGGGGGGREKEGREGELKSNFWREEIHPSGRWAWHFLRLILVCGKDRDRGRQGAREKERAHKRDWDMSKRSVHEW